MNQPHRNQPSARRIARQRGQPLVALGLLMVSWVGARAAMWEAPTAQTPAKTAQKAGAGRNDGADRKSAVATRQSQARAPTPMPTLSAPKAPTPAPTISVESALDPAAAERDAKQLERIKAAEAHQQLLFMANQLPLSEQEANVASGPIATALPAPLVNALAQPLQAEPGKSRPEISPWSGDAWLLMRPGGSGFNAPGAGLPGAFVPLGFYGGSQTGAVLRFRLSTTSDWRPTLYLRAASGIERPRGEEAALGFAFRPLSKVPVSAMIEGRATRTTTGTVVRPAAALVTELPPFRLPLGIRAEAYLQGGYVAGRDATGFVDGQLRIEKPLVRAGALKFRAGGGAWGGAQRGAQRLDLGPTATLELPLGGATSRLSADYRFRLAGSAAPDSGPAVTVSVGF